MLSAKTRSKFRKSRPVIYASYYPILSRIAKRYGYCLAMHGSLRRDFDLVAIPWVEKPKSVIQMFWAFNKAMGMHYSGSKPYSTKPTKKPHGRISYTLPTDFNGCYLDISVMPIKGRR